MLYQWSAVIPLLLYTEPGLCVFTLLGIFGHTFEGKYVSIVVNAEESASVTGRLENLTQKGRLQMPDGCSAQRKMKAGMRVILTYVPAYYNDFPFPFPLLMEHKIML